MAALLIFAAIVLYVVAWPVPIDPVAWEAPTDRGLTGVFDRNDLLRKVRAIDLGEHAGPEDVALGLDGFLYATTHGGKVLRISPGGRTVDVFAQPGGRPLGIEVDSDGSLLIANAVLGVQRISTEGVVSDVLTELDGTPLLYADDLAIARDGTIYLSEASTKFGAYASGGTLEGSLLDILEHGGHGRIFEYSPTTQQTRVIMDGLNFANGIAISDDQNYLLVNETGHYRVLKLWLEGPHAGTTEVILDNLPGFPDNINNGLEGKFWIGLVAPRNKMLDDLSGSPFLRKVIQRMPAFVRPKAVPSSHVIAINGEGQVLMNLQDSTMKFPALTGVYETQQSLYLTSLFGNRVGRLDKKDLQ